MFDEPANGLDPEGIIWLRATMRTLAAEGRAVFPVPSSAQRGFFRLRRTW